MSTGNLKLADEEGPDHEGHDEATGWLVLCMLMKMYRVAWAAARRLGVLVVESHGVLKLVTVLVAEL